MPVESTADLIMRRAEQIGDFDQFKTEKEVVEAKEEQQDLGIT